MRRICMADFQRTRRQGEGLAKERRGQDPEVASATKINGFALSGSREVVLEGANFEVSRHVGFDPFGGGHPQSDATGFQPWHLVDPVSLGVAQGCYACGPSALFPNV